jgi:alkylated DNA nucleotide flippase Atl1
VTAYEDRVYALCKKIPAGKVSTYGELARVLNSRYSLSPVARECAIINSSESQRAGGRTGNATESICAGGKYASIFC